jgi:hypothetical protein
MANPINNNAINTQYKIYFQLQDLFYLFIEF